MHKRYLYLFILGLIILGIIFIVPRKTQFQGTKEDPTPSQSNQFPQVEPKEKKEKRRIIGQAPSTNQDNNSVDTPTDNTPNEEWQDYLEETLRTQGGSSIESIEVKKVEPAILKRDQRHLAVESVVITLTKPDGSQSSFRALVDSETGKILETWDRPVFDPVHPNDNFKVKVPAHYHGN